MPKLSLRGSARRNRNIDSRRMVDTLEQRLFMHAGEIHQATDVAAILNLNNTPAIETTTITGTGPDLGITTSGTLPLASLQKYHSRPGATVKLYLDFNGYAGGGWGQYTVPAQSAWSTDADNTTFSDSEQKAIYEVWARVAEKYSPFNIDVTTEDPGNRTPYQTLAVVFASDDGAWLGAQAGGIAYINSFRGNTGGNTVFVLPKNLSYNPQYSAEGAAHESGHAFGLNHQAAWSGTTKTAEYNPGTGLTAPIMGAAYSAQRGLWWNGTSAASSTTLQDDLAIISSSANRFGYATDDHGSTVSTADALSLNGTSVSGHGVIEQMTDADAFSFNTGAGAVTLTVNSAAYGAMLDFKISLYDSSGTLVASANTSTFTETLNLSLNAGTYKLVVASNGAYGDIGQYRINGTVAAAAVVPEVKQPTLTLMGDVNNDGAVNSFDLNVVAANWLKTGATWGTGDFNGDGTVNSFDLNLLASHWLESASTAGVATTTDVTTASTTSAPVATLTEEATTLLDSVTTHGRGKGRAHRHA
jgi:hypothetical protein